MDHNKKEFPDGMTPLGRSTFKFECHPGVDCFTVCCQNVDLTLYPYDILRLKTNIGMDSEQFIRNHTFLVKGDNPLFPSVKLKLTEDTKKCPFLSDEGCTVYVDRPSACRTYPLERAVDRSESTGAPDEYFFLTKHDYCHGHREPKEQTVDVWNRNQKIFDFNTMNTLWTELDTIFATNPWKGEGAAGEKQQLAFMVCYNVDGFRRFADSHNLIKLFQIGKHRRRAIVNDDSEIMKFGFEWLKLILTGKSSLIKK